MVYTQAYIDRKIKKCEIFVDNATSEAQKKIYQGYLDFWKIQDPDPDLGQKRIVPKTAEIVEVIIDRGTGKTELFEESALADIFELENAPKQAYYNRDGKTHKTKAFKEYLNQRNDIIRTQ